METTQAVETQVSTDSSPEQTAPSVNTDSSSSANTPSPQQSAKASKLEQLSQKAAASAVTGDVPVIPSPYTPNYKFKSFDKEYEMDEFVRQAIKDKDSEAKLRSIYEKAYGLDVIKPRYQEVREKYQTVEKDHKTLTENIKMLDGYLTQGNYDDFFKTLQIPEQQIYKYVLDKLNYQDLPADQKQLRDQFQQTRQQATMAERANQQLAEQFQQASTQLRSLELDSSLSRPDIKSIVDAYDTRKGTPGSFRNRVIMEATSVYRGTGKDLTPEEAVRQTIELLDLQSAQQQQVNQEPVAAQQQAQVKPPVIPNIAGKSSSPAKKVIKNLSDLRKRAQELNA